MRAARFVVLVAYAAHQRRRRRERLIERHSDPDDGRRTLLALTERGIATLEADRRHREGWLARGIAEDLSIEEQQLLAEALVLLERLAEN